ncbi:thymidine phosphorylase family protein [Permianibacter sp. IMCC34836]|uniref:thymidine phosphorylase family protein n=1 Tax=Permianibacter fluminis TaxID=2738515 RepID=UPI001551D8FF|nr:thymidine phosphorylase family protein [Permianibacter fluminis]NQD37970.1 thymidine phosphorylase family protein [Permianibacter fluminis]
MEHDNSNQLRVRRMGIDTHQQAIAFMSRDCHVCRSEGFNALSRIALRNGQLEIIADLDIVEGDGLPHGAVGLSEAAWKLLKAEDGDFVHVSHPAPLTSLGSVRAKLHGQALDEAAYQAILVDIVAGRYSDVHLTAFIAACAGKPMTVAEIGGLTSAMVTVGQRLEWGSAVVLDKHCVGGLPGNRTTPLVVAIIAANGLLIPKTSSRAITSPAGTADTMEVLAPVNLTLAQMRAVVEREGGCVVWGGAVSLSPADDILIRIERVLDIDSEAQLVASVLSKKVAAGASHVLIDIPVGPTAKLRDASAAQQLAALLHSVGDRVGLTVQTHLSDGTQPVGRGIGPALEAHDILAVLQGRADAPRDLRERAVQLAGKLLELAGTPTGQGYALACATLDSGAAWHKFLAICDAQGGLRQPPVAPQQYPVVSERAGLVCSIDNRVLARIAKLAGAPGAAAAGITLHVRLGDQVTPAQPLFTVHAETRGELAYALDYYRQHTDVIQISEERP